MSFVRGLHEQRNIEDPHVMGSSSPSLARAQPWKWEAFRKTGLLVLCLSFRVCVPTSDSSPCSKCSTRADMPGPALPLFLLSRVSVVCPSVADVSTFDGLQHLEAAFRDENQKGRSCVDLYEVVQHCGNIVPRL